MQTAGLEPTRRPSRLDPPKRITATVKETCSMTGLGATKINELIRDGKLKSVAIGRRRLVFVESIEALLNGASVAA